MDTQILIAWNNIHGLLLSIFLSQHDIDHLVIGKKSYHDMSEIILYPRVREFFERLWMIEELGELWIALTSIIYEEEKIPLWRISHRHPIPRLVSSTQLYDLLLKKAQERWVKIMSDMEVFDYKSRDHRITATLTDTNKKELVQAEYLCITDRSVVTSEMISSSSQLFYGHLQTKTGKTQGVIHSDQITSSIYTSQHEIRTVTKEKNEKWSESLHTHTLNTVRKVRRHNRCFFLAHAAHSYLTLMQHDFSQWVYDIAHIAPQIVLSLDFGMKWFSDRQKTFLNFHENVKISQRKKLFLSLKQRITKEKNLPDSRHVLALDENIQLPYAREVHCGRGKMLFMRYQTINVLDYWEYKKWPSLWSRAPHGHLVVESNKPKRHRKKLVSPYKLLFFVFVWYRSRFDDDVWWIRDTFLKKRWDVADMYIVTNNYDISKHDWQPWILGDADAEMHKQYAMPKPGVVCITSDGVICFRSCGVMEWELDSFLGQIFPLIAQDLKALKVQRDQEKKDSQMNNEEKDDISLEESATQ